jgi:UPF0271 protein
MILVMPLNDIQKRIYCIDSSAILSGKPFYDRLEHMISSPKIEAEFSPGGKDYQVFQYLKEKGLQIRAPTLQSINRIRTIAHIHGEIDRLSDADKELLALAFEIKEQQEKEPILVSDDYSMQNVASLLSISFQSVSQQGITKKFKWERRCRGCGRHVEPQMTCCPICGSSVVHVIKQRQRMKNNKCDQ